MVEGLWAGKQLGISDALSEFIPRHDRLDGGEGIFTRGFGVQQGLSDLRVQAYFVVDRFTLLLKLLLMLVSGTAEQLD
ncbi:hypothetical protein ALP93_200176 [Pseudomonas syringae pv. helianthi]|nr:hypothetical protein ALP93_200176 [Pseudomonas syringae pv. helianthi]